MAISSAGADKFYSMMVNHNQYTSGYSYIVDPNLATGTITTTTSATPGSTLWQPTTWPQPIQESLDIPEGYKFSRELYEKVKSILDLV